MATDFMCSENAFLIRLRIVAVLICLFPMAVRAAEITVIGLFPNKAVVVIDGGAPRVLTAGQQPVEGVSLLSTDRETATLLIDGQKKTLKIGQHHGGPTPPGSAQSATLTADAQAHFVVEGQLHGGGPCVP